MQGKLQVGAGDFRRVVFASQPHNQRLDRREQGIAFVLDLGKISIRIVNRPGGIANEIPAMGSIVGISGKISAQGDQGGRSKNRVRGYGLQQNGEMGFAGCTDFGGAIFAVTKENPAIGRGGKNVAGFVRGEPAAAVEIAKGDAAPAKHRIIDGRTGFYPHDDGGIFFDLPVLAQFDVIREAAHQGSLQAGAGHVSGVEAREKEEQHGADDRAADGYGNGGQEKGAMETAIASGIGIDGGKDGSGSAAADFQADESGHAEDQEGNEEDEEISVHSEDRGGEYAGEGQHGKEQTVAIGGGAVQADDGDKEQEMYRGQQDRKENGIGGV